MTKTKATEPRQMGRPPKSPGDPKTVRLELRLTPSMAERLAQLAEQRGISRNELVERLISAA